MSKLSSKKVNRIVANVKLSLSIEGIYSSIEAQEISTKFLKGEITNSEAKSRIFKLHSVA